MESLIGLVNRIERAYMVLSNYGSDKSLLTLWEALPFVAVVSGHNFAKSSSIVRRDFLPREFGIVTCRPLILHLHKTDKGQTEHVEFLHSLKRRFSVFGIQLGSLRKRRLG